MHMHGILSTADSIVFILSNCRRILNSVICGDCSIRVFDSLLYSCSRKKHWGSKVQFSGPANCREVPYPWLEL